MKEFKQIIQDVIYISRITKTKNKKILTIISVFLSQFSALIDISIIAIFSVLIAEQYTSIKFVNSILDYFVENKLMIVVLVTFRYVFQYLQKTIIYKLELSVNKNLKIHILEKYLIKETTLFLILIIL